MDNNFSELFENQLSQIEQEEAKNRQEEKEQRQLHSLGNVMKSVANLYFTAKGAPSQTIVTNETKPSGASNSRLHQLLDAYGTLARLKIDDARNQAEIQYKQARRENDQRRTEAEIHYKAAKQDNDQRRTEAEVQYKAARQDNEARKTDAQITSNKEIVAKARKQQKNKAKKKRKSQRKVSLQTLRRRLRNR